MKGQQCNRKPIFVTELIFAMSSKSDNKLSRTLYPEVVLFKLNYAYCVGEDQILNNKVVSIIVVCSFFLEYIY